MNKEDNDRLLSATLSSADKIQFISYYSDFRARTNFKNCRH